jgi:hypothetical protein
VAGSAGIEGTERRTRVGNDRDAWFESSGASGDGDYPHLFTLKEARALIPRVRRWLRALQSLAQSAERVEEELGGILPTMRANGSAARASSLEQELSGVYQQMARHVQHLLERGIVLRDVVNGVVDFPSQHQGRVIMLCWQVDEDQLGYWHEADSGFLTRQPLDRLARED